MPNKELLLFFIAAFCCTLALVPLVIKLAPKIGAVEHGGYRKINRKPVVLIGGIAIALPFILLTIVIKFLYVSFVTKDSVILVLGVIAIVVLGVIDDTIGVRARTKLLVQLLIAALVCATSFSLTNITIPFVGTIFLGSTIGGLLSVVWIVGLINAFNLIDGVDGLATGLALIAAAALAVLAALNGNILVVALFIIFSGSLFAFLFFNFNPARIFLGDTGSMLLGYIIGILTLMGAYKSETAVIVFAPLLVLGLPIFETLVSMIRRYIRGVPIFSSDKHHTHHRLLNRGYSQRKVVLLLYSVAIMFGLWAIVSRILPLDMLWVPVLLFVTTLVWMIWLAGYICVDDLGKIFHRRNRNVLLAALAKYVSLTISSRPKNRTARRLVFELCREELHISYLKVANAKNRILFESGDGEEQQQFPSELLTLNASTGERLTIYCQYNHNPNELERHDVVACLANIFSAVRLS